MRDPLSPFDPKFALGYTRDERLEDFNFINDAIDGIASFTSAYINIMPEALKIVDSVPIVSKLLDGRAHLPKLLLPLHFVLKLSNSTLEGL